MRNTYHKPQHEVFIRCMLRHGDTTKAYRRAYPKASGSSARIGGIRLNNYPHIRQRIQPVLEQRRKEADQLTTQLALARLKAEVLRRAQIRSIFCGMVNREIKKDRHFIVSGQQVTLQEDISHRTLINLISLDQKLANGYNNWPSIERQFAELTHNISKLPSLDEGLCQSKIIKIKRGPGAGGESQLSAGVVEKLKTYPETREKTVVFKKRQQTVINSIANPIPASLSKHSNSAENIRKNDNKTATDNKTDDLKQQHHQLLSFAPPPLMPISLSLRESLPGYEDRHL